MLKITIARTDLIKKIEARRDAKIAEAIKAYGGGKQKPLSYAEYKARIAQENKNQTEYAKQYAKQTSERFDRILSLLKLSTEEKVTLTERDEFFSYI